MFLHEKGSSCRSLGYFLFTIHWIAILSSGSKVNDTQKVASLMGQLFDDSKVCKTPTMELGFLVSGGYNEPMDKSEKTFRKALRFVRNMAQKAKVSDSGTHIGLVVYGKNPYLAFDFNQYFDIAKLSQAIEEVKTPIAGSNLGQALSFTKDQLYNKSARPDIPKTLIVLSSKRSEDTIGTAVKDLKDAGVKILTVAIGSESDPLEMNDLASDFRNTLISDENHLDALETNIAPKLCRDVIEGSGSQVQSEEVTPDDSDAATQTEVTLDDSEAAMNPSEEPGAEIIAVTPNETPSEETDTGATSYSPNAIPSPKQPKIEENKEGPRANKVDLVFLVQSSGKMGVPNWIRTVLFMKYVVDAFDVSKTESRLGLVVEGRTFHVVVDFNRLTKKTLLLTAIGLIPLPFGDQKIGQGLTDVKELVLNPSGRPNVPHILIVVTDGKSSDDVTQPLKSLEESGVEIFAVGFGNKISLGQLAKIASYPSSTHVYHGDFKEAVKLASKVVAQIYEKHYCGGLNTLLKKLLLRKRRRATKKKKTNVHAIRKPITSHDATDKKEAQAESTPTNDDTFEDAMFDPPSNHSSILDTLFESGSKDNRTMDPFRETCKMYKTEPKSVSQSGVSPDEEHDETEESSTNYNNSANMTTENTPGSNNKHFPVKDLANKICSAKADIGILIDGSSSVTEAKFEKLLDFTKGLSKSFSVSKDHTHIAVATASRGPRMSFDFEGFNDIPSLDTAISRISYNGGPFLLGSSLTGIKTSWFKNSGRKSIPQLLLVLATTPSIDDIAVPSREMRDRGVRIEAVGIGSEFEGGQLKEIATHPAQDHVLAVSKYELLPMIRPLLTFRMCRAVGGKLITRPDSDLDQRRMGSDSATAANKTITNKVQPLPGIKQVKHDLNVGKEMTVSPPMKQEGNTSKLAATLKQLDQYKMIRQQSNLENGGTELQDVIKHNSTATNKSQQDEIEKEKLRKDIRRKLYSLIRRLGGTKKDVRAAYRSIIYNINGHHDTEYCKDHHDLCKQWTTDNLCEKGNDIIDAQSVQRVCPRSCQVCF
ncbi:collagen alpha-1(XII) chain-like isoform X2 [Stylophora pistillata]|uniref:collagen alpha-1(XII) chain-like isoform X2 n=1 Tax=Stylophora pistillata TaxID=50429 RepID=UPI000C054B08|nr:collagen alpha-1(XII) chain-like isoform X2 [Stylophora pistillata]